MKKNGTIFKNFLVQENNPIQLFWDFRNKKKNPCLLILIKLWNLDMVPFPFLK